MLLFDETVEESCKWTEMVGPETQNAVPELSPGF